MMPHWCPVQWHVAPLAVGPRAPTLWGVSGCQCFGPCCLGRGICMWGEGRCWAAGLLPLPEPSGPPWASRTSHLQGWAAASLSLAHPAGTPGAGDTSTLSLTGPLPPFRGTAALCEPVCFQKYHLCCKSDQSCFLPALAGVHLAETTDSLAARRRALQSFENKTKENVLDISFHPGLV